MQSGSRYTFLVEIKSLVLLILKLTLPIWVHKFCEFKYLEKNKGRDADWWTWCLPSNLGIGLYLFGLHFQSIDGLLWYVLKGLWTSKNTLRYCKNNCFHLQIRFVVGQTAPYFNKMGAVQTAVSLFDPFWIQKVLNFCRGLPKVHLWIR